MVISSITNINQVRRRIGKDFRRDVIPGLNIGNIIQLPNGDLQIYHSNSTTCTSITSGRPEASISLRYRDLDNVTGFREIQKEDPKKIPESFVSSTYGCTVPIYVTEARELPPENPYR